MNKSIILFCCLLLSYSKAIYSQEVERISIQFTDQSLLSALYDLEKVSAFRFVFQDIDPEVEIVSGLEFEQVNTFQILNTLLADTGFDFVVTWFGREPYWVVVYKTNISTKETDPVLISVTGRVYGEWAIGGFIFKIPEKRSVVSNESVLIVDNSNFLVIADMNDGGSFYIPSVDKNARILVHSWGTFPRVVPVKEAKLIELERDTKLDGVIITIDNRGLYYRHSVH